VPPKAFLEVIDGNPVGTPYAQTKGALILSREFPPSFPLKLALKDANLVLEAAERHGARLALTEAAAERFRRALELGHGDEDMAAVYHAAADD
jgi:3-hydroxyisobutyrate dehydrogenase